MLNPLNDPVRLQPSLGHSKVRRPNYREIRQVADRLRYGNFHKRNSRLRTVSEQRHTVP